MDLVTIPTHLCFLETGQLHTKLKDENSNNQEIDCHKFSVSGLTIGISAKIGESQWT